MSETKVTFLRAGFYPANQRNLKSIQKALARKNVPPKKPLCVGHVNRLLCATSEQSFHVLYQHLICALFCDVIDLYCNLFTITMRLYSLFYTRFFLT